jgi:hypothetical protein
MTHLLETRGFTITKDEDNVHAEKVIKSNCHAERGSKK